MPCTVSYWLCLARHLEGKALLTLLLCALGSGISTEVRTMCSSQMCNSVLRKENVLTVFLTAVVKVRDNTAAVMAGS